MATITATLGTPVPAFPGPIQVGDTVRVTRNNPNQTSYYNGYEFVVGQIVKHGNYTYYVPKGEHDSWMRRVTAANLMVAKRPEAKRTLEDMTKEEFAKHVVDIAQKYAAEHGWCSVVDEALIEMGLAEYTTTQIEVSFTVRVPATFDISEDNVGKTVLKAFGAEELDDLSVYS